MNSLSRTQKPRAGFTLLEVMVVIVILGVLASLVVPNLLGNKEKADRQKAISDIVALENALDMYRLDNGRYPTTEQGLEALIQQPANMADSRNYRTGGYIKRLPKDPWGNDYQYLSPGEKGLFDVYTLGADGQENGEGAGADSGKWKLQELQTAVPERGFTLLEIMLVIFLIGLASAGVVQTFATASEPPAKKAAQDFLTRYAQFKDRAVIEGKTLGVLIDPPGYQFMQRRHGQWLPVSSTRLSAQVTVPKQVQMLLQPGSDIWQKEYALELQRRRLTLHDIELELQKEAKKKTPQIRFSPFEPVTPFTLRFYASAQNACWAVKLAHDGALSLNQCDEGMP